MPAKATLPQRLNADETRKAALSAEASSRQIFGHVRRIESYYSGTFAALIELPFQVAPIGGSRFLQVCGENNVFQQLLATAMATGNMIGFRGISVAVDFPPLDGVTYEPPPTLQPTTLAEFQIAPLFVRTTTVVNYVYNLLTVTLYNVAG
jgi:hypothetical protein